MGKIPINPIREYRQQSQTEKVPSQGCSVETAELKNLIQRVRRRHQLPEVSMHQNSSVLNGGGQLSISSYQPHKTRMNHNGQPIHYTNMPKPKIFYEDGGNQLSPVPFPPSQLAPQSRQSTATTYHPGHRTSSADHTSPRAQPSHSHFTVSQTPHIISPSPHEQFTPQRFIYSPALQATLAPRQASPVTTATVAATMAAPPTLSPGHLPPPALPVPQRFINSPALQAPMAPRQAPPVTTATVAATTAAPAACSLASSAAQSCERTKFRQYRYLSDSQRGNHRKTTEAFKRMSGTERANDGSRGSAEASNSGRVGGMKNTFRRRANANRDSLVPEGKLNKGASPGKEFLLPNKPAECPNGLTSDSESDEECEEDDKEFLQPLTSDSESDEEYEEADKEGRRKVYGTKNRAGLCIPRGPGITPGGYNSCMNRIQESTPIHCLGVVQQPTNNLGPTRVTAINSGLYNNHNHSGPESHNDMGTVGQGESGTAGHDDSGSIDQGNSGATGQGASGDAGQGASGDAGQGASADAGQGASGDAGQEDFAAHSQDEFAEENEDETVRRGEKLRRVVELNHFIRSTLQASSLLSDHMYVQ